MSEFETQLEEHLLDLGIARIEDLATRDHGIQPDTLKAECLVEISFAAGVIAKEFRDSRHTGNKLGKKSRATVLRSAQSLATWASCLLLLSNVEVMTTQDVEEYAKEFELELQHDAILGCFTIQAAVGDLGRLFYMDAHAQLDPSTGEELVEALDGSTIEANVIDAVAEVMALACIISSLAGNTFKDTLIGSF
jgi:hypothetical protein